LGVNFGTKLTASDLKTLTAERKKIDDLINNGVIIKSAKANELKSLQKFLVSQDTPINLYKILPEGVWLDAKLFTILYNRLPNDFKSDNLPNESMRWLTREGEEFYFYFTVEELINYLYKFCGFFLKNTNKEGYLLSPVHIKYGTRDLYVDLLDRDMVQVDENNFKQDFITSKAIITFQLINPDKKVKSKNIKNNEEIYHE
jgi:hypothetical protein